MKGLLLKQCGSSYNIFPKNDTREIKLPLCESDIMFLQKQFLKNELHTLKFETFEHASQATSAIIGSLGCFKNIGYLSEKKKKWATFNITKFIEKIEDPQLALQELFWDNFYFDFLYIEDSKYVKKLSWYKTFLENLKSFGFDHSLPIIMIQSNK